MTILLRQSTAASIKLGPFVDDTDGKTAEDGLTIAQADIRISKNGGAYAQTHNAAGATHDEAGEYTIPLDTTDTGTLGRLKVKVHVSGALPAWQHCHIVPANVYDSLILGTDYLQSDLLQILGTTVTEGAGGRAAGSFSAFHNVASPVLTTASVNQSGDGYSLFAAAYVVIKRWFALLIRSDSAVATDYAAELALLNASGGSGAGSYSPTTDSQQAIRDRGDAYWADSFSVVIVDPASTPDDTWTRAEAFDWLLCKEVREQTQSQTLQTVSNFAGTVISTADVGTLDGTVTRGSFEDA